MVKCNRKEKEAITAPYYEDLIPKVRDAIKKLQKGDYLRRKIKYFLCIVIETLRNF